MFSCASRFGLWAAMATPFDAQFMPDHARLVRHARELLSSGCDGVTVFGTTGEGPGLGLPTRAAMLAALDKDGVDFGRQVIAGVAAASVEEALAQSGMAIDAGCRALLLAPPFYFKGVTDDALFRWFAQVFDRLGAKARDVLLYHIPSVTAVPLSSGLVGRLKTAFPGIVLGVKDSSGDWNHTEQLLAAHKDLIILVGDERHLARAMRMGASGTICGVANVVPDAVRHMVDAGEDDVRVRNLVDAIVTLPVVAAVKALIAHRTLDPGWMVMRPPLRSLSAAQAAHIALVYDRVFMARAA